MGSPGWETVPGFFVDFFRVVVFFETIMAILIEDGTGKTDAVSFASVAEAQSFAAARGFTLPATNEAIEQLLVKAADFMLQFETRFQGFRTFQDQRLPFPRVGIILFGFDTVQQDEIPTRLKEAQIRLAVSANTVDIRPDGTGQEVLREKVGPLEVQYAQRGTGTVDPQFNQAMDLLEPFFITGGSGLLRNVRA